MEEGGARLALGRRLASIRYSVGGRPKRVHYWVARVLSVDDRAVPNHEVDEVTWLPVDRAVERVSYHRDHGVLAEFAARPQATVPLILLRHAKALPKDGWKRADHARPLGRLRPLGGEVPGRPARLLRRPAPADQLDRGPLRCRPSSRCPS